MRVRGERACAYDVEGVEGEVENLGGRKGD